LGGAALWRCDFKGDKGARLQPLRSETLPCNNFEVALIPAGMRGVGLALRQHGLRRGLWSRSQRAQNSHYAGIRGKDTQAEGAKNGGEEDQCANQAAQIRSRLMDRYRTAPPFPASSAVFGPPPNFSLYPH